MIEIRFINGKTELVTLHDLQEFVAQHKSRIFSYVRV